MTDISKTIGQELIRESQGPQQKKRGISDDLFPFILVASMNGMSSRAISRWLDEKQEIKLSAAMIAKVIRESDKRCLRLYDQMRHQENQIRFLSSCDGVLPSGSYLFDKNEFEGNSPYHLSQTEKILADEFGRSEKQMYAAHNFIMEEWFSLPEEFRKECQRVVNEQAKEQTK